MAKLRNVSCVKDHGMLRSPTSSLTARTRVNLSHSTLEVTGLHDQGTATRTGPVSTRRVSWPSEHLAEALAGPEWPDSEHPGSSTSTTKSTTRGRAAPVLALGAAAQHDPTGPNGYGSACTPTPSGHPFCLCRNKGVTGTDQAPSAEAAGGQLIFPRERMHVTSARAEVAKTTMGPADRLPGWVVSTPSDGRAGSGHSALRACRGRRYRR